MRFLNDHTQNPVEFGLNHSKIPLEDTRVPTTKPMMRPGIQDCLDLVIRFVIAVTKTNTTNAAIIPDVVSGSGIFSVLNEKEFNLNSPPLCSCVSQS